MKWYKHLSGSLNDSFIFDLIEQFGGDGYLVFFGTLELMADEFDIENPGKVQLSIKKLTKNLQLSRQKTLKILKYCDEKERIFCNVNKNYLDLDCPRLQELTDEYTQKMLKQTSGQTPDSHRDKLRSKEVEAEVRSKNKVIYSSCPHKKIIELYHSILPELAKIKEWTPIRMKLLKKRWNEREERQTLDWWKGFFEYIRKSKFLMGDKTDFQADLEWLIRPTNFVKVIEGKYEDK